MIKSRTGSCKTGSRRFFLAPRTNARHDPERSRHGDFSVPQCFCSVRYLFLCSSVLAPFVRNSPFCNLHTPLPPWHIVFPKKNFFAKMSPELIDGIFLGERRALFGGRRSAIKNSWISSPLLLINGQSIPSDPSSGIFAANVGEPSTIYYRFVISAYIISKWENQLSHRSTFFPLSVSFDITLRKKVFGIPRLHD